ncbi:MAG TPA: site-specific integrase [Candidatus Tidjanibacter faecipullorum]|uniref:Site-specific integrase n=1 Tax=Candidatus Tidjanibacter faecipullorum TaxID=2838766 RepID=A0A9D2IL26_9BACT|nr:site-specific integrase [Candidatus Tidjanibacter faecipullorum]
MTTFLLASPTRERSTIDILVSFRGKKYRRTTKESLPVKYWNKSKKRAKATREFPIANDINTMLDKWEVAAMKTVAEFKEYYTPPSTADFFTTLDRNFYKDSADDTPTEQVATFLEALDEYIHTQRLSRIRLQSYAVLRRSVERYQLYVRHTWILNTLQAEDLRRFEQFLRDEHTFFQTTDDGHRVCKAQYQHLYANTPENRPPTARGNNTIAATFTKVFAVLNHALDKGWTDNHKFRDYSPPKEIYGTPYYLSLDEVRQLYECDLSDTPTLAVQRDIFVFQCLIGCRIGDLYRFSDNNIIGDTLEYVPYKTKGESQRTVQVPLNNTAREILARYHHPERNTLFPLISQQRYNDAIKTIFTKAGLTRNIIIINPVSGIEESVPLNTVASSHLARRTFVGNLYKRVKDPNLIGVLSGHVEGSKAFARYREIDHSMKQELTQLIDLQPTKHESI